MAASCEPTISDHVDALIVIETTVLKLGHAGLHGGYCSSTFKSGDCSCSSRSTSNLRLALLQTCLGGARVEGYRKVRSEYWHVSGQFHAMLHQVQNMAYIIHDPCLLATGNSSDSQMGKLGMAAFKRVRAAPDNIWSATNAKDHVEAYLRNLILWHTRTILGIWDKKPVIPANRNPFQAEPGNPWNRCHKRPQKRSSLFLQSSDPSLAAESPQIKSWHDQALHISQETGHVPLAFPIFSLVCQLISRKRSIHLEAAHRSDFVSLPTSLLVAASIPERHLGVLSTFSLRHPPSAVRSGPI